MKVLLLGYSDIARRRVLPALHRIGVNAVDIASVSAGVLGWPGQSPPRRFFDYQTALTESDAEVVYVSTINNLHAELAMTALQRGFHVILDKPAFLSLDEASAAAELADAKRLCLAESTVYGYHPRYEILRHAFEQAHSCITRIVAVFSMPPRPIGNFRYSAVLGGGALWDLGPYAISPGRLFFKAAASEICGTCSPSDLEVESAFNVIATYSGGRSLVGTFGFTTGYMNRIDFMGPEITVTVDRAFSTPPDMTTELIIRREDHIERITAPPADTFALFLDDVARAISSGNHSHFAQSLLGDAREMTPIAPFGCRPRRRSAPVN